MISDDLKIRALRRANMMGMSLGRFIRESLEKALQYSNDDQLLDDTLFADDAVFHGQTPNDLAEKHDDYLYRDGS